MDETNNPRPARRGSVLVGRARRPRWWGIGEIGRLWRAACAHPAIDLEARGILRAIIDARARTGGHCAPTLRTLAGWARCSVATVKRRLQLLEAAGFLLRERRAVLVDAGAGWRGPARWCQTSTAYHLAMPADCEAHAEPRAAPTEKKPAREQAAPAPTVPIDAARAALRAIAEARQRLVGELWRGRRPAPAG